MDNIYARVYVIITHHFRHLVHDVCRGARFLSNVGRTYIPKTTQIVTSYLSKARVILTEAVPM